MEVGGWVQVSLGIFLVENHPKIALNQLRYSLDDRFYVLLC